MRRSLLFALFTALLFVTTAAFAQLQNPPQEENTNTPEDNAFWVNFWSQPKPVIFGPQQAAFNENMKSIMFSVDEHAEPTNPDALDANAQWLKDHPDVRFYVNGYASTIGDQLYNLVLSGRRAEWVKQQLVERGIPEDRIVLAVGWGELYPACAENDQDCWNRNQLVRFSYAPTK